MAEEKVTVIVENHQRGNRQFPGWKKKYPKLFNIPGEIDGAKALITEVDAEDLDQIKQDYMASGISVRDYDSLDEDSKSFFGKIFSKIFGDDEEPKDPDPEAEKKAELVKQWIEVIKKLDRKEKAKFKGFKPRDASIKDLEAEIAEATKLVKPD